LNPALRIKSLISDLLYELFLTFYICGLKSEGTVGGSVVGTFIGTV